MVKKRKGVDGGTVKAPNSVGGAVVRKRKAAEALVMSNPANIAKHQSNPKVGPIIAKMMAKMNGGRSQQ